MNIQTVDRPASILVRYFFSLMLFLSISPYALQASTKAQIYFCHQVLLAAWLRQWSAIQLYLCCDSFGKPLTSWKVFLFDSPELGLYSSADVLCMILTSLMGFKQGDRKLSSSDSHSLFLCCVKIHQQVTVFITFKLLISNSWGQMLTFGQWDLWSTLARMDQSETLFPVSRSLKRSSD